MPVVVAVLAGALVGSALATVARRLPSGEPRVPRRFGRESRAVPAPGALVATLSGCAFGLVVGVGQGRAQPWLGLALVAMLVPVALVDLDHRIIPNSLLAVGTLAAVGLLAALAPSALARHLGSGIACGAFLGLAAVARPGAMGMGDVKLAAVIGLYLGPQAACALAVALAAGTLWGLGIVIRHGAATARGATIPFAPFLALGGLVALCAGQPLVSWYAGHVLS